MMYGEALITQIRVLNGCIKILLLFNDILSILITQLSVVSAASASVPGTVHNTSIADIYRSENCI